MINWLIRLFFKFMIGGENMIDLYIALIIAKRRTINQVPLRYQDTVRADLLALGLDENGDLL